MKDINTLAEKAARDENYLSEFIDDHKRFIKVCAYKVAKKYISEREDEWSIALIAFSDAVKTYSRGKGNFLSYAETVIKNRLIDYYRSNKKHELEYSVNPNVFDLKSEDTNEEIKLKVAVAKKLVFKEDNSIKYEIEAITEIFKVYGFSFYDLADCSPKSAKTKAACRSAVLFMLENEDLLKELKKTRQLPVKTIQNNTNLPRKLIEHHRRYIIAAVEILSGEYPYLAEYVSFIRKGGI